MLPQQNLTITMTLIYVGGCSMKWQAVAAVLLVTMIVACESFLYPPVSACYMQSCPLLGRIVHSDSGQFFFHTCMVGLSGITFVNPAKTA